MLKVYEKKKEEIKIKLAEFKQILNESDERVFAELAFCICTPQSKATVCWDAVSSLMDNNLLYIGKVEQIRPFLNSVRFADGKAKYIVDARKKFTIEGMIQIKDFINSFTDPFELREWFAENVEGLGMKESSHFIRNIGLSKNQLAILDRYILKNLKKYGVIHEIPKNIFSSKKNYLQIENKMKEFSNKIGIPLEELDLLFWSEETGIIFK